MFVYSAYVCVLGGGGGGYACICRGIAVCTYLCMADSKIFPRLPRRQSYQKLSSLFKSGVGQNDGRAIRSQVLSLNPE